MERYVLCEIGYKSLLSDYKKANGDSASDENLRIEWSELKRVLKRVGIDPNSETVKTVFDGTRTKGKRNARGLRNSLAHSPNKGALDELGAKKEELFKAMDDFVELLSGSPSEEKGEA